MPPKKKAKSETEETPEVTTTDASGEEIKASDSPYASGEVSLSALRQGARDNDSVRRLQFALNSATPGSIHPSGNYGARTAGLVAQAVGEGDGSTLTKAQASKVLGKSYTVVD